MHKIMTGFEKDQTQKDRKALLRLGALQLEPKGQTEKDKEKRRTVVKCEIHLHHYSLAKSSR